MLTRVLTARGESPRCTTGCKGSPGFAPGSLWPLRTYARSASIPKRR